MSYDEFEEGLSISSDTGFESDSVSLTSDSHDFSRSDSPKPSARVMPMVRHHISAAPLGRPSSPGLNKAMRGLGLHDPLRRVPSDPSAVGVRFKPQHPQHAAMGAVPVATAVPASAFEFEGKAPPPAPCETEEQRKVKRQQKKLQTQKAFPILVGLSETHKQLSPRLGRAVLARTAVPAYQSLSPQHSPRLQQRGLSGSPYSSPTSSPHGSPKAQPRGVGVSAIPYHPTTAYTRDSSQAERGAPPTTSTTTTIARGEHQGAAPRGGPAPSKPADSTPPPSPHTPAAPLASGPSQGVKLDNLPPLQSVVKAKPQSQSPQVAKVLPQPQTPGDQLPRKLSSREQFPCYQLPQQMVHPLVTNGNKAGLFDNGDPTIHDLAERKTEKDISNHGSLDSNHGSLDRQSPSSVSGQSS